MIGRLIYRTILFYGFLREEKTRLYHEAQQMKEGPERTRKVCYCDQLHALIRELEDQIEKALTGEE